MDETLYTSLVKACLETRSLESLPMRPYVRKGKKDSSPKLTAPACGAMIKAHGQACIPTQVGLMRNEMIRGKVQPTMITRGCMVESLVRNASADDAWKLI